MAELILGGLGTAIGAGIGGSILGMSAATIGGFVGSAVGSVITSSIIAALQPEQRIEGARLDALRVTSSTEGAVLPRLYGRMRLSGNIIWATDFREEIRTTRQGGGKGGGGGGTTATEYVYHASFAVALCEGPITGIGRVWADGKPLDLTGVTWRWYPGDEAQEPDAYIAAQMGADATPAYRGTAYVVFEDIALERFGNRLPQLSFEVFSPVAAPDTAEGMLRAVTLIPGAGEFAYATQAVRREMTAGTGGETSPENVHAIAETPDLVVALDRLQAMCPGVESVSLVVSWFGDDLRAGDCRLRPGVEIAEKITPGVTWQVNGITRADAYLVSQREGRPAYGGTPSDASIVQAIQEIRARGLRVTLYPFVLMDIPEGNSLPDPYSDAAASPGQPAFPWRGRITCAPAAGFAGSVDKTPAAADQVAAFFGGATPAQFAVAGESVSWTGPAEDWGLRRMLLHYAHLSAAAGGVDAFVMGSELRGLTRIRSDGSSYPAVQALRDLAGDLRVVLGPAVKLGYAADWSEYFGHQPQDGSGDVFFHLDPLWSDAAIDFVGIDAYMPLSDWRDGWDHLDAQAGWPAIHDRAYLQSNIAGGEGYDWFYASDADRAAQIRSPITDGAGKPWVFRTKDLVNWWSQPHFDRPGGVESVTPTSWVPQSKPIWFTEFGCPAVDRGTNQPNVFVDPKSSESAVPYFSRGWRDDTIQRAALEAVLAHWGDPARNPVSPLYGGPMVHLPEAAAWTWDARPYPVFPELADIWSDGANWRLGHWLTGRLGAVPLGALVRDLCARAGLAGDLVDVSQLWGAVEGYLITAIESPRASIAVLARQFGFDAIESEGRVVFRMRGRGAVGRVGLEEMLQTDGARGEAIEITRAQETELPQALQWQLARADEDYDAALVEARRITVETRRIAAEAFAMALPPEEAERRCRRALMEAWVGRESARFHLPPSWLAVDPGDVLELDHDGRVIDLRVVAIADGEARAIEAVFEDRAIHDLPPGEPRAASLARPVLFGATATAFMNLPQLREGDADWQPMFAAFARPWPGTVSVWRSPAEDDFTLVATLGLRARFATLVEPFGAGPGSRFDLANALTLDLATGTLASVSDIALFNGANALAIESAPGIWEIVQFARAELIAPARYRLTRLLRGQRGTEAAIAASVAPGARVVVLDEAVVPLALPETDIGQPWSWRVGPGARPVSDDSYVGTEFTPTGAGLRPFSVCHVEQPRLRGRVPGDLTIRWTRRSRALVADSWEAVEVPLAEASEAYEVDILDGESVLRTLTTATPSVLYSAAAQTADWGAALGPGDTLTIRIAQISALIGRGAVRIITLQF